jgi:hypothetical protein
MIEESYNAIVGLHVGQTPQEQPVRKAALKVIFSIPDIAVKLRSISAGETFRVVISKENARLFKQAADGYYKPYLLDGRKFVENVNLAKIPVDYVGAASNVLMMVNMQAISAKLDAILVGVENVARIVEESQRGRLIGALNALAAATALNDPTDRRREMLSATRDIVTELGAVSGQLKAHIAEMPKESTGLLDGIFGTGFDEAQVLFKKVAEDVSLLVESFKKLLLAYKDLGEYEAAKQALAGLIEQLNAAGLKDAIRKSRLLPVSKNVAVPEEFLRSFFDVVSDMKNYFISSDQRAENDIVIDLGPEDLTDDAK